MVLIKTAAKTVLVNIPKYGFLCHVVYFPHKEGLNVVTGSRVNDIAIHG